MKPPVALPLLCPSVTPPSRDAGADELQFWLDRAAQSGQPILTLAARADEDAQLDYAGELAPPAPTTLSQLLGDQPLRLAGACAGSECLFYAADKCELASSVARHLPPIPATFQTIATEVNAPIPATFQTQLPRCAIRARCRWFAQIGVAACARCPLVSNRARATPLARHIRDEALTNARAIREEI